LRGATIAPLRNVRTHRRRPRAQRMQLSALWHGRRGCSSANKV